MSPLKLLALIVSIFAISSGSALAFDVTSFRIGVHPDKERAVISISEQKDFRAFVLDNPTRIVIDLPNFNWRGQLGALPTGSVATHIRNGAIGSGLSRFVIETNNPVAIQSAFLLPAGGGQSTRLVIDYKAVSTQEFAVAKTQIHGPLQGAITEAAATTSSPLKRQPNTNGGYAYPSPNKKPSLNNSGNTGKGGNAYKPLIILDPGHGGDDPGARGANGVYEKQIVLAVGLELKRMLENSGKFRVKMTRDKDYFIPLRGRVKFARDNGGDLFMSLHADSISRAEVSGASIYTLSEKASDSEAAKLAERENKSDLIAGIDLSGQEADVTNILLDLATRDTMNQSHFLSSSVASSFRRSNLRLLERPQRSAGFAVLKALDIPSVLVEMGYLTNRQEVERLSSPEHRKLIAAALAASIEAYFANQE